MKTVKIDETVVDQVSDSFKNLEDTTYKLTKIEALRPPNWVSTGDFVVGPVTIFPVAESYGVRVWDHASVYKYIRTSPVVEVLDTTESAVTFRTEGGVYKLEQAVE